MAHLRLFLCALAFAFTLNAQSKLSPTQIDFAQWTGSVVPSTCTAGSPLFIKSGALNGANTYACVAGVYVLQSGTGSISLTSNGAPTNPCMIAGQSNTDTLNHVFYLCPAVGGSWFAVGGTNPLSALPYAAAITAQTSVSVTAVTHGQGSNPIVTIYNAAGHIVQADVQQGALPGDLVLNFAPAFTGTFVVYGGTGGFSDPMTTAGDITFRNGANATTRLPVGGANTLLGSTGTVPTYGAITNPSNLMFDRSETGHAARSVDSKLKENVSVKDFGCVGDGVTDDALCIQRAITAACTASTGSSGTNSTNLLFPHPSVGYLINSTATVPVGCNLLAVGHGLPAIISGVTGGPAIVVQQGLFVSFRDIQFQGPASAGSTGILISGPIFSRAAATLTNVVISGATTATVTTSTPHGFVAGMQLTMAGITTSGGTNANGAFIVASAPTTTTLTYTIAGSTNATYTDSGMQLSGGYGVTKLLISGCNFLSFGTNAGGGSGLQIDADTPGGVITSNVFNNSGVGVYVTSFTDTLMVSDNYMVSTQSRCIDIKGGAGAGTVEFSHNNMTCRGGAIRAQAAGYVHIGHNEYELTAAMVNNANSAPYELLGAQQIRVNNNTCNLHSNAAYCYFVGDSIVYGSVEENWALGFTSTGIRRGSGQLIIYADNDTFGTGSVYTSSYTGTASTTTAGTRQIASPTTALPSLIVSGGASTPATANINAGQICYGDLPGDQMCITMDANSGKGYIDNTFNNAAAAIAFRLRTSGTPLNVLSMVANGDPSLGRLQVTNPATSAVLTVADGSILTTVGAFGTTLTSTATTNSTLPAGTHSLAPLDSPAFTSKTQVTEVAVASLPTCNAGAAGSTASVNDNTAAPAWASTAAGGGSVHAHVYCNGTNWTIAGK